MCGMISALVDVNVEGMGTSSGNEGGLSVNEDITAGVYAPSAGKVSKTSMVTMTQTGTMSKDFVRNVQARVMVLLVRHRL
uniref:Uncharacterized protein n=1 Tax=Physcomitrium patens TaxID=3218 RepID=A0A2K1K832_PHYPA|nr:hypothetical protein PHYPA_011832 [Physcomitrium patens]